MLNTIKIQNWEVFKAKQYAFFSISFYFFSANFDFSSLVLVSLGIYTKKADIIPTMRKMVPKVSSIFGTFPAISGPKYLIPSLGSLSVGQTSLGLTIHRASKFSKKAEITTAIPIIPLTKPLFLGKIFQFRYRGIKPVKDINELVIIT